MACPRFLGAKVGEGWTTRNVALSQTHTETNNAPNAQFRVASEPGGRVTWREATQTREGSVHILTAQELNLQPTCCG